MKGISIGKSFDCEVFYWVISNVLCERGQCIKNIDFGALVNIGWFVILFDLPIIAALRGTDNTP